MRERNMGNSAIGFLLGLLCLLLWLNCPIQLTAQNPEKISFSDLQLLASRENGEHLLNPSLDRVATQILPDIHSANFQAGQTQGFRKPLLEIRNEQQPFFCRIEHQLSLKTSLPFKFRLGSVEYVDWLEGKPGCSSFLP